MSGQGQSAKSETWDSVWERTDEQLGVRRLAAEREARRWRRLASFLHDKFGDRHLKCIELGSGEGDFSVLLAALGHDVTLVDFSPIGVARAQHRFRTLGLEGNFVEADLFEFTRAHRGQMDVVLSVGVAEHFSDVQRQRIIAAHAEPLRPGGVAFISVPYAWCVPYRLWKFYLELRGWWAYGYEEPFSERELRRLALQGGFSKAATYKTQFLASVDACFLGLITGRRRWWGDGPEWVNQLNGWTLNLLAETSDAGRIVTPRPG